MMHLITRRRAGQISVAALLCGCASVPVEKAYVAPSDLTITSETQEGHDDAPSHIIYVSNRSTVPIRVFGTRLSNCENIKQQCAPRNVSIRVLPNARVLVTRIDAENPNRAWTYNFGFSWRPDSSTQSAIATALGTKSEMTPRDFSAMRDRIARIRVEPESLLMTPGQEAKLDQFQVFVVDKEGKDLGVTHWLSFRTASAPSIQLRRDGTLVATGVGRGAVHYSLAQDAQALLPGPLPEVSVPIVVAYRVDPRAPVFSGTAVDADSKKPLSCANVALEDSAKNEVGRSRTNSAGKFELKPHQPGSYRVRVDLDDWSPFYGPMEVGLPEEKRDNEYAVRFTERLMGFRSFFEGETQGVRLAGAVAPLPTPGAPPGQNMRLAGSATLPIIEIISRATVGPTWLMVAVDDAGRADSASLVVPSGTVAAARTAMVRALPQLRFSAARQGGNSVCGLIRLQVNFTPR
jgi:hypothetical protein